MKKTIAFLLFLYSVASFSQTAEKTEDTLIYDITGLDVKPEFPGGIEKLKSYVNQELLKAGIKKEKKETIHSLFVVEKDGSLSDVKILRSREANTSEKVIEILKTLPRWNPGKQAGKPVRALFAFSFTVGN